MLKQSVLRQAVSNIFNHKPPQLATSTKPAADPMRWINLSTKTFEILKHNLVTRYGNILSPEHQSCLMRAAGECASLALGRKVGRRAFGLDTGFGKTELVVAFLAAVHRLGYDNLSVMVCQFKVEALCELKRKLLEEGVPEWKIGLIYAPTTTASEPCTPVDDLRQFQFVTHNRVANQRSDILKQNYYMDKPRSLVIWDESFLKSEVKNIQANELIKAIDNFSTDHKNLGTHSGLINWLRGCKTTLADEEQSQQAGNAPIAVALPEADRETIRRFSHLIDQWKSHGAAKRLTDYQKSILAELLLMVSTPIRMTMSGDGDDCKGQSIISYRVAVPEEFTSMVILDASVTIRELVAMDDTVTIEIRNMARKRYDAVTIHQMFAPGGRESMTKDFSMAMPEDRKIALEIIAVIKSRPEEESFIIFTFKTTDGECDFEEIIRQDMTAAGIDSYATIDDKRRFVFLKFGSETSTNGLDYCSNVIMAGVLHLRPEVIEGFVIGQRNNITHGQDPKERKRVDISEKVHRIYQALSRGSCRRINNGAASPMNAWIIHRDTDIREGLNKAMSSVKWATWEEVTEDDTASSNKLSMDILAYLDGQEPGAFPMSIASIKQALGNDTSKSTWTRAMNKAFDLSPRYERVGRSVGLTTSSPD